MNTKVETIEVTEADLAEALDKLWKFKDDWSGHPMPKGISRSLLMQARKNINEQDAAKLMAYLRKSKS